MTTLETEIQKRILILDGAMGTMIQKYGLEEKDFRGDILKDSPVLLKGNNDLLVLTCPDVVEDIHRKYLTAGADIIETNTFNAQRISQGDYHCESLCTEMNRAACRLARKVADEYTRENPDKPRFVAGSIGPTNKTCSISTDVNHPEARSLGFDELAEAYGVQISVMIQEGVDALLVETIFDTLNAKAAAFAAREQMEKMGKEIPLMFSVTLSDKGGHTLSGQNLKAFLTSIEFAKPLSVGLNCSFGPTEMKPYLEELSQIAPYYISVYPNAGLPNALGGYDITPLEMAELMKSYVEEGLVNVIGGCCGTTDEFIAQYPALVRNAKPHIPQQKSELLHLAGLERLEVSATNNFMNIGERCNVAGSRKFLRLINEKKYDEVISIARKQVEAGAQVIDINMDDGLLDARAEMVNFVNLLASDPDISRAPLMIDSSNWDVIVAALKCVQGKSIVNSISLKEGEEKFLQKARQVQRMGAAVVVMAFDEEGQATSYEKKICVCERAYHLLVDGLGFMPQDIIFDPNILSIATGMEEHNNYAVNFIRAAGWIRKNLPGAHVSGGVSNLSFSFRGNNYVREAMHAVFLFHAIRQGMDMGIVNPASRVMYDDIPTHLRNLLEDVVLNRRSGAVNDLMAEIEKMKTEHPEVGTASKIEQKRDDLPLDERISQALIKGNDENLETDLEEAVKIYPRAVNIIEGPLMKGMAIVGEHFANGKMFLPQVVRTAKTMQKAVAILTHYIKKEKNDSTSSNGTILLATVKGDVHDIGKNIVGVVLACNNFEIIDLGVMVPPEKIAETAREKNVDIVGLCGLITPSLQEMINTAQALNDAKVSVPLMIGGATTSELHTALKIDGAYNGPVIWSKDAAQASIVASTLVNPLKRDVFLKQTEEKYEHLRNQQAQPKQERASLEDAQKNKLDLFDK